MAYYYYRGICISVHYTISTRAISQVLPRKLFFKEYANKEVYLLLKTFDFIIILNITSHFIM